MSEGSKHCSVCKEVKLFTQFFRSKKEKTGYSSRCKACEKAYSQSRAEQRRAYSREYVKSEKYKTRMAMKRKEATLKRMQHKVAAFQNMDDAEIRRWRLNAARRYSARLQATPLWLNNDQKDRALRIYAATQQLQELTGLVYHVDHIVPLVNDAVCGLHVWWNLQPMAEHDNLAKNNLFDPAIFPLQGEVAFPDGAGPFVARIATQTESRGIR